MRRIIQFAPTIQCIPLPRYKLRHRIIRACSEVDSQLKARTPFLRYRFVRIHKEVVFSNIQPIQTEVWGMIHRVLVQITRLQFAASTEWCQLTLQQCQQTDFSVLWVALGILVLDAPNSRSILSEGIVCFSVPPEKDQTVECMVTTPLLSPLNPLNSKHPTANPDYSEQPTASLKKS
jgi:hypothetical protein